LPDELAALGEQLRDDAVHLAACYPSQRTTSLDQRAAPPRRNLYVTGAAMVCGAAVASIVLIVFSAWRPLTPIAVNTDSSFISTPAASSTTLSLSELSGPELEALLDLIEHEPKSTMSVSF
jgi:hypothetical protein